MQIFGRQEANTSYLSITELPLWDFKLFDKYLFVRHSPLLFVEQTVSPTGFSYCLTVEKTLFVWVQAARRRAHLKSTKYFERYNVFPICTRLLL